MDMITIQRKQLRPGIIALEISGVITMGLECDRLGKEIEALVAQNQTRIILDLAAVHRLDSAGLGKIVYCLASLRKKGGDLRIAGAKGIVADAFRLTTVNKVIGLFPTAASAADSFDA